MERIRRGNRRRAVFVAAAFVVMGMFLPLAVPDAASGATGLLAPAPSSVPTAVPSNAAPSAPATTQLEQEKLREEVRKLRLENERNGGTFGSLILLGPLLAVLVGLVGLGLTVWKQISDNANQRREFFRLQDAERNDRVEARRAMQREREADRQQREVESLRRFDEGLSHTMQNLGSDSEALQLNAAAALATMIRPRYAEFVPDIIAIAVANLKVGRSAAVTKLLVAILQRGLRQATSSAELAQALGDTLDLSRAEATGLNLEGVDVSGLSVDLGYAKLEGSNFTGCSMRKARGYGANLERSRLTRADLTEARLNKIVAPKALFHEARLISATLKEADLRAAQFQRAKLQSAHFENADLRGARFEQADIGDTFFAGAQFDDEALRSLQRAQRWQDAHFDANVSARLREGPPPGG